MRALLPDAGEGATRAFAALLPGMMTIPQDHGVRVFSATALQEIRLSQRIVRFDHQFRTAGIGYAAPPGEGIANRAEFGIVTRYSAVEYPQARRTGGKRPGEKVAQLPLFGQSSADDINGAIHGDDSDFEFRHALGETVGRVKGRGKVFGEVKLAAEAAQFDGRNAEAASEGKRGFKAEIGASQRRKTQSGAVFQSHLRTSAPADHSISVVPAPAQGRKPLIGIYNVSCDRYHIFTVDGPEAAPVDFIFMLTRGDRTVEDCLDLFELITPLGLTHVGFKDIGVPPATLHKLADAIRRTGAITYMEVVSETEAACLQSARVARELGIDRLLGGTQVEAVMDILKDTPTAYYPFPGRPAGHPTRLGGTPEQVEADCRGFAAAGCAGADLLAYRATEADPLELIRAARRGLGDGHLIVAGSVGTKSRISAIAEAGANAFTIGSAVFDGSYSPTKGSILSQLSQVIADCQ